MKGPTDEEERLRSTALQNVTSILQARQRAEEELVQAKEALEARAKELARSVSTLRATLESTTDAILVTGPNGEFVDHNDKLLQIWGVSHEKLSALDRTPLWETRAHLTDDAPRFLARLAEIEGSALDSFDQIDLTDGRVIERSSTVQVVDDEIVGRVWSFRDVTERKFHEAALRSSHAQFSAIIHYSPVCILLVDSNMRLRQANPSAQPMLAHVEPVIGRDLSDVMSHLWPAPVADEIVARFRRTLESGESSRTTGFSARRRDTGVEEHYDWEIHRLTLPDGRQGVVGYFIDVSTHERAQAALRDSEQRVRATFEQAAVGMALANLDGRFTQVNRRLERILGWSAPELCARVFFDVTYEDDRAVTRAHVERLMRGEITDFTLENRYLHKDGTLVWSLTTVSMIRSALGQSERFIAVIEDISQRKRSEERERESAKRLELALSAGRLGDWSWVAATDVVTLGPRAAECFGLVPGSPTTWAELRDRLHPDDRDRTQAAVEQSLRDRSDYDVEYRVDPKARDAGDATWIAARGCGIYAADGTAVGMIGVVQEVTERKRLELLQQRMAAVVESSDDAIISKDLDGTVRTWNSGAQRIFGYGPDEMIGTSVKRLIPPELHVEEDGILARQRRGERVDHYETVRVTKEGRRIDVSLTVSPIRDSTGKIVGASKVARDITDRKRAEAELRRSEEEFRALADSIPQLAWVADAQGNIQWYNLGWYEYTGTTLEEMQGWGWKSVHDPEVLPRVIEEWTKSLREGVPFEMEFPLRGIDGKFRWFLTRIRPIRDSDGRIVRWFGTNTDVDEVKRAREALSEETRLLNLLNETGKSIAADLDLQMLVQSVTDSTTALSGAEFGAYFQNVTDKDGDSFLLYTLSGADRSAFEKIGMPRATPLFAPTYEGKGSLRIDDVLADERYGKWAPHHGMPRGHLPVRSYLAVPVVSRTGDVIGALFFGHSTPGVFTERIERTVSGIAAQAAVAIDNARLYERVKQAAEERQELLDAERSARAEAERVSLMKDEFLATLSHELRTPLNAIVGWSQVLRMRGHSDPDLLEGLTVIDRNAKVQAQLIEDLLDMSRIISGKVRLDVQRVDIQEVVGAALASVRHSAESKDIRLQIVLDPHAGPVLGDPSRLQQCFWNLLSNAIKFTPKSGRVHVTLARVNSHVEFTIVDSGSGIAPEFLPHVFERFRQADASTTRNFGGLGLGLSIVKSLVELHGGTVRADSAGTGKGATFCIELPVIPVAESSSERSREHPRAGATAASQLDHPSLQGITVLAIDDEPDARNLLKRVLEDCGARVLLADSAREGFEILQREQPDILISDIGMPGEDGYALIRRVRQLSPEKGGRIPAAALSAFARPEDRTRALRAGYQMHLSKPVEPTELTAVIASLVLRK